MKLNRGFLLILLALLAATLLGTTIAWRNSSKARIDGLRADRYSFSLGSLRAAAESGLKLGLDTNELPAIAALMSEIRTRHRDIISIDIFDARGRITLSSDNAGLGTSEPAEWREPCLAARGEILASSDADGEVQCAALLNAYDQVVGGIALQYKALAAPVVSGLIASAQSEGTSTDAVRHQMLLTLLVIPLGVLAVGAALGNWRSKPLGRQLKLAYQAMRDGSKAPELPVLGPVNAALESLTSRSERMTQVDAELEAIDQLGTH
jgi:hypothetical protein